MTETAKAPRTALTLKFDAEQAISIFLLAKFQEQALDDLGGLSEMIAELVDETLDEFRNPAQPAVPDRHLIVQASKSLPLPTQPDKGAAS